MPVFIVVEWTKYEEMYLSHGSWWALHGFLAASNGNDIWQLQKPLAVATYIYYRLLFGYSINMLLIFGATYNINAYFHLPVAWIGYFISDVEYTYLEKQYCSGGLIGTFSSLEAAKAACKINSDCQCIHDEYCSNNGGSKSYYTYKGVPSKWTSGDRYCAWIPGNDALISCMVEIMCPYFSLGSNKG